MEMLNYELGQTRIADLKALKNPLKAAWQGAGLWESLGGWWQSLRKPAALVSSAYRAELMRQEWMVNGETVKSAK